MEKPLLQKTVLKRATVLFGTSLAVLALCAGLVWWHHTGIAQRCTTQPTSGEPTSCHDQVMYLGPLWTESGLFLLFFFVLCILIAWAWSLVRRRKRIV